MNVPPDPPPAVRAPNPPDGNAYWGMLGDPSGTPPSLHPPGLKERVRSRRTVGLLAIVLVTAAIAVVGLVRSRTSAGPLAPRSGNTALEGAVRAPGHAISIGVISFDAYDARTPVVLESVRPVSSPVGLRLLGFSVIRTDEHGGVGTVDGFPPRGFVVHPVAGYSFTGDMRTVQVIVGLEATRAGAFVIPGFALRYRIGTSEYEATYPFGAAICTRAGLASFC